MCSRYLQEVEEKLAALLPSADSDLEGKSRIAEALVSFNKRGFRDANSPRLLPERKQERTSEYSGGQPF
jgi:hypothetical protein